MREFGLKCWRGSVSEMPRAHSHSEIELNYVESGGLEYLFGGSTVRVEAGELAAFWAAIPHQVTYSGTQTRMHWLTLPLAMFLAWELPRSWVQGMLGGQVPVGIGTHDLQLFESWERDLAAGQAAGQKVALLEIEARLLRMAMEQDECGAATARMASASELGRVEKMAAFIAENYTRELSIESIARHAGVHPNYAMNLFKNEFGLSLGEFLTRTRLSHAQRLLATSERGVLDIAFDCGFGSASRFHAAFKRICGKTPAIYRAELRRGTIGPVVKD